MKGQDFLLLFKVVSIQTQESGRNAGPDGERPWVDSSFSYSRIPGGDNYSLRFLSATLGLSKSEVSNSLSRCCQAGLLVRERQMGRLTVNHRALLGITEHALKHFFPVRLGPVVRGIPTAVAISPLADHLKTTNVLVPVWPDSLGNVRGQAIEPLYKTVPQAAKMDATLYRYLALADAVRVGGPRECEVAIGLLREEIA